MSDFQSAYPQGLERTAVLDAIVTYERSLVTPNSRFDRYLRGDSGALTAREKEGYRLFKATDASPAIRASTWAAISIRSSGYSRT